MPPKIRVLFEPKTEPHAPDLYDFDGVVEGIDGFGSVGREALRQYHEDGFLLVRGAFSAVLVDAAKSCLLELGTSDEPAIEGICFEGAIRDCLPDLNEKGDGRSKSGRTKDLMMGCPDDRLPDLDPQLRLKFVRKFMGFAGQNPPLGAVAKHPPLLQVVERFLDAPPKLHQDMALVKPPGGREKPWHQDRAYFNVEAQAPVVGVWIALDEATPQNGCMRLVPRGHKAGPHLHFWRRDWQICDTDVPLKRVAAPMAAGDCLLFDSLLPHGTPFNATAASRWALQFHYAAAGAPSTSDEHRLAVFGAEGKNVSC